MRRPRRQQQARRRLAVGFLVVLLAAAPLAIWGLLALTDEPLGQDSDETATSGGTTTQPEAEPAPGDAPPGWAVAPTELDFGRTVVGVVSDTQELRAASRGGGPTAIGSIEVEGDAADFQVTRQCVGAEVPAESFCRVQVQFTPTSAGDKEAVVVIGFDTDDRTLQARIIGTGV